MSSPGSRLLAAGIAALTVGFAFGLRTLPPRAPAAVTTQAKNPNPYFDTYFDAYFNEQPSHPARASRSGGFQLASLESTPILLPATEDEAPEQTSAIARHAPSGEEPTSNLRTASFDQRFAGSIDWPTSVTAAEAQARASLLLSLPDLSGPARRASGPSIRAVSPLSPTPPAAAAKKQQQLRVADAPADDSPSQPSETDEHTAIYDIAAHKVYLPNGRVLEAHSGLGNRIDDPHYVSEKDRGATPPNIYDLTMREEIFHGVRAIRLNPVGGGNMYGREGLLAHSYMLGPNGQSNGCVSFRDYEAFLGAFQSGEVTRLVVVDHLTTPPNVRTASGWIPRTLAALFGPS